MKAPSGSSFSSRLVPMLLLVTIHELLFIEGLENNGILIQKSMQYTTNP
jgi:hypothetical protein